MLNVEIVFSDKGTSLERVACLRSQRVSLQILPRQCGIQLRKPGPNNDDGCGKFVRRNISTTIEGRAPARYRAKLSFLALLWRCERGGAGGLHASLFNGVNSSSSGLKKFGFTRHTLQEGI
jgi:hypothetical protein